MKHRVFNISLFIIYIVLGTGFMIWQGIGIAPDRYAFLLLIPAFFFRKMRNFLFDWLPFLFILISYDFLRGFADQLGQRVHFFEPIWADEAIFHTNLVAYLQGLFFNPASPSFLDYLATIFYFMHFALPLAFGFLLWINKRDQFRQFVTGILILSYGAWLTYVIYPAAPPWMAAEQGYLPGVTKILDTTLRVFPERIHLPTIYEQINPNPVAAIPSLHAAYPFLVFLFALKFFKKRGLIFFPYVLGVWFSVVYLGEHYAIDVIIGAIYALASYMVAIKLLHNVKLHTWLKKMQDKILVWSVQSAKAGTTLLAETQLKQKKR